MTHSKHTFVVLMTVVLAFTAFCIETDIYAPSFPDIVIYFATSESYVQNIITANFIGLCLSSLVFGPLSDSYGRKFPLCIGLALFAISSVFCIITESINSLIFWRFIQGIGSGAITGIGCAMVFDHFSKESSARLISILNSCVSGIMAIAPLLGNWVNINFGWRMNFGIIAVLAILTLLDSVFLLKETLPSKNRIPFNFNAVCKEYYAMLTNTTFISNTLLWTMMFGLVMVFIANLSLLYIDHLNVPQDVFGWHQASIMTTFFVASLAASKCIAIFGMEKTKKSGTLCASIAALGLITVIILGDGVLAVPGLLTILMNLYTAGVALSCATYYINSMADFPKSLGTLSALTQAFRLLISGGMIAISSSTFNGTMLPIAYITAANMLALLFIYKLAHQDKSKAAQSDATL